MKCGDIEGKSYEALVIQLPKGGPNKMLGGRGGARGGGGEEGEMREREKGKRGMTMQLYSSHLQGLSLRPCAILHDRNYAHFIDTRI